MSSIPKVLNLLKESILSFLYPSSCLYCQELLSNHSDLFCEGCMTLLQLIDPDERCSLCFSLKDNSVSNHCTSCQKQTHWIYRQAAAFEYIGPAAALIKSLKYGNQPYLAKGAGAFLVAQFINLNWPLPDAIIPVPMSWTHWLERGYNQSELLANAMGELLNIPVYNVLGRKSGDYSQAGLSLDQRKTLDGKSIYLKENHKLGDKTLLLIDDVYTSGTTMAKCAEILMEGCPIHIYGLTFCRA